MEAQQICACVKSPKLECQTNSIVMSNYRFDADLQGFAPRRRYWHLSEEAGACSLILNTVMQKKKKNK